MTTQPSASLLDADDLPDLEDDPAAIDEALDDAARGNSGTSDQVGDGTGEIDALGDAAGLPVPDGVPLGGPGTGIAEVERRDAHRWELDPASAEGVPV